MRVAHVVLAAVVTGFVLIADGRPTAEVKAQGQRSKVKVNSQGSKG
jgi:hypothetical protein